MLRLPVLLITVALAAGCDRSESTVRLPAETPSSTVESTLPNASVALSYDATGDDGGRISQAQSLVATSPSEASSYLELAGAFLARKRQTGDAVLLAYAANALDAAEEIEPNAPRVLALRGVLLQEKHEFTKLAALAATLIAADPADSTGHLLLGDAKLEVGDYDGAITAYEDAMARYPDLRVYSRGAHIRWLHGDVDGALELLEAALDSASSSREHVAWVLTEVGALFLRRGEVDRAVAAADRADGLVASYPPAFALRARAEQARGNFDAARDAIEKAIAARASAADYFLLAEIEERRGNGDGYLVARKAGLRLADHDPIVAAEFLARRAEDPKRALALIEAEVASRPTIEAYSAHAMALFRVGRVDDAAVAIEKALRLGTPLAELHLGAGLIKLASGDRSGAEYQLARAKALNPLADARLSRELTEKLEVVR